MTQTAKTEPLLPVYLIVGEDALKRNAVVKRLRTRLAALGDLEFDADDLDGETALGADIVVSCNTMPFASDVRLVYVRNADKLKKADSDEVVAYLGSPNPTTVLALEAEKLAKNTRLYKAIAAVGSKAVIDCTPPKRNELPKTVRAMAVSHGVTFSDAAARRLVELVGENTVHLDNEIKKIAIAHRGKDSVSDREVESLVARTAEVRPWEFVDAFSARDLARCVMYLEKMESVSPHALIGMCVSRLRELMCAQSMMKRGSAAMIPKALKLPDWRVKNHAMWARGYSGAELRHALIAARDAEQAMKSGSDPDQVFFEWMIGVLRRS